MQSKDDGGGSTRARGSLTQAELISARDAMVALVAKFDAASKALRSHPADRLPIPWVRDGLAEAGHHLLRLIHHGVIEKPAPLQPWLSWSVRTEQRRPRFLGFRSKSLLLHPGRGRTLSQFVRMLFVPRMVGDAKSLRSPLENMPRRFRHRHVFLEAIEWLGRRTSPRVELVLPTMSFDLMDVAGDSPHVTEVVVEWDGHTPDEGRLLFAQIAEAASQTCDQLVRWVDAASQQAATVAVGQAMLVQLPGPEESPADRLQTDPATAAKEQKHRAVETANETTLVVHASDESGAKSDGRKKWVVPREPTAMQVARRRDVLLALPPSTGTAMDGNGVLVAKLRERAAHTRQRERIAVRHDKDSLRRDLIALRKQKLVDPKLLLRTKAGDCDVKRDA